MRQYVIVLLVVMVAFCALSQTQTLNPALSQRLGSFIDARLQSTKCPGLSVAVASHNEIVLSKALGKADLEQDVALKTTSVQRLASLSKPITGTIIMDLIEQGKLSVDSLLRGAHSRSSRHLWSR